MFRVHIRSTRNLRSPACLLLSHTSSYNLPLVSRVITNLSSNRQPLRPLNYNRDMLLANGIGSALFYNSLIAGLLSLVVAFAIETPVLRLCWKRKRIWRWVLAANVLSLAVGVLPTILWFRQPSPGELVDPWQWYQTIWLDVLRFSILIFLLTVFVEAATYLCINRKVKAGLSLRRIAITTLVANTISYVPMVALLVHDARTTGSFTFLPDTTWIAAGDTRAYFVDQTSNQIHSIRLDGSDLRRELDDVLGRFLGEVHPTAFYALLDDDPRILYVAPDRQWYVSDGDSTDRLSVSLPDFYGNAYPGDVGVSLRKALEEVGVPQTSPEQDYVSDGAYLSSCTRFEWKVTSRQPGPYRIWSGQTPYPGTGHGLGLWNDEESYGFKIWAGFLSLACNNPAVLPDDNTVVFRCGDSLMVMDIAQRRVGRLTRGDSLLLKLPQFTKLDSRIYDRD